MSLKKTRILINTKMTDALNNRGKSKALSVNDLNKVLNPTKPNNITKTTNQRLEKLKSIEAGRVKNIYDQVVKYVGISGNIYVTFGGVGDLILILAEAYKDENAKIIFFSNHMSSSFGECFLKLMKKNYLIQPNPMGNKNANTIIQYLKGTGRLKTSAHLADNLDYGDWKKNQEKYKSRMTLNTNWVEDFGKIETKEKIAIICPTGSFRSESKQRFLLSDEYLALVHAHLKNGYFVYTNGSENDMNNYPVINSPKHMWLTSDSIIDFKKNKKFNSFEDFIKIINSASHVVSMDTWLKTYTLLAGIKTHVIMNRNRNGYIPIGIDVSDYIFLSNNLWEKINLHKIDEFIINIDKIIN